MKYGDLIQFESVTANIQLKSSSDHGKAVGLVSSYVISDKMSQKLSNVIIEQLQYEESVDNKALWIVGNYGSGKSHLMSVISAVAEFPDLASHISNEVVRESADKIAGKFKVIRFEIGATKMPLTDIITQNLTDGLAAMGVDYEFPPMTEIASNHKPYFEEMMAVFHEKYPDHGLLLVCDEMLDYFRSRNAQELPLDIAILRVIGEVIDGTRFRFMAGVQEAIFDSTQLEFLSDEVKRIRDRAEQVLIAREDIKYVVSERLLKKDAQQQAWIREYLQKFTPYYDKMNERLDEFVRMFPVHPDYINTFERVRMAGLENRQVLKSLSRQMNELMEEDVPENIPGIFSYDTYWNELSGEPSMKTNPEVGQVIETGETLVERIEQAYPRPHEKDFAKRLVAGLAIHRMAVGDIYSEMGATAAELRDSLCLYHSNIEAMPGEKNKNLENYVVTVLRNIHRTVNGQFFSKNKTNDQFYLDLKKTEDFDAHIEAKAAQLASDHINDAYRAAMLEILEQTDTQQSRTAMWQHELKWIDRNVSRPGWLFLGSPNERETAKPQLDYYMYFVQPENPPKQKKEFVREDEVQFVLKNRTEEFNQALKNYAASTLLRGQATGSAKQTYKLKADGYLGEMLKWIRANIKEAYEVEYNGKSKPIMDWLKGATVRDITGIADSDHGSVKDIFEAVASFILGDYFESLAPEYPKFSQRITEDTISVASKDVLSYIAGGAATKRATAVLDALELLEGEKLKPTQSRYAKAVLGVLNAKGHGQVVNQSELLEAVHARLYFKPEVYRLEKEWLLVILASLVQAGEIELAVVGKVITASDVDAFKGIDFNTLVDFKHIQAPKDFNISAIKAVLSLLGMNEGLATSIKEGDDGVVREMGQKIEDAVKALVHDQQQVKQRLLLWGNYVLSETEAQLLAERLGSTKSFLESLQRFNTPGKLKNFKETVETIEEHAKNLQEWQSFKQLAEVVNSFSDITQYLTNAQLILTESDEWQQQVKVASVELRNGFEDANLRLDSSFKQAQITKLETLKKAYMHRYVSLYQVARLTVSEDKQKSALNSDERLQALESLSGITLLPADQVKSWRSDWAALQVAESIDPKKLELSPNPVNFSPRTEDTSVAASERLAQLDAQLKTMLADWTFSLKTNLEDPMIQLDLLKPEQKSEIEAFVATGNLPLPVNKEFVDAINQLLSGLEEVKITSADLVASLGKGTPQTLDDVRTRFEALLTQYCQGKDNSKVRIIIE
ncbi:DUF6079 family protein [Vibrio parahaemolyticus]|uniref:DUF6079 family protein n=1 Tax=Vibrio parahaemolyticus TaxID=670 RepID=UPI001FABC932|nr:DUF6079 family protein [Vibrio parahaemolyticus]MCI9689795.1 hypothetical protein [Vibrio parahaemolyticus]